MVVRGVLQLVRHRVEEDAAQALGLEPEHGPAAPRLGAEALDAEGEGPPEGLEEVVVGPGPDLAARDGEADHSGGLLAGARGDVAQRALGRVSVWAPQSARSAKE